MGKPSYVKGYTKRGNVRTIVISPASPSSDVLVEIWSKTGDAPLAAFIVNKAELLDAINAEEV